MRQIHLISHKDFTSFPLKVLLFRTLPCLTSSCSYLVTTFFVQILSSTSTYIYPVRVIYAEIERIMQTKAAALSCKIYGCSYVYRTCEIVEIKTFPFVFCFLSRVLYAKKFTRNINFLWQQQPTLFHVN